MVASDEKEELAIFGPRGGRVPWRSKLHALGLATTSGLVQGLEREVVVRDRNQVEQGTVESELTALGVRIERDATDLKVRPAGGASHGRVERSPWERGTCGAHRFRLSGTDVPLREEQRRIDVAWPCPQRLLCSLLAFSGESRITVQSSARYAGGGRV